MSLADRSSKRFLSPAWLEQDNQCWSAADQMLPSINIPTLKDIYRSLSKAEQLSNKGNHEAVFSFFLFFSESIYNG